MDQDHANNLRDNSKDLANVFKSLAHESRLEVLSHLVEGEKDLKFLLDATGMSKNGLVNHLATLMEAGIVDRVRRGKYRITGDGEGYVQDAVDQYLVSERYQSKRRRVNASMYRWRGNELSEKIISNPAVYKSSWFSYQGAVQGVMNSLGVDVSLSDVIAVSGYGWITNALRRHLCPSAPSAFHRDVWMANYEATRNLGIDVEMVYCGEFKWGEDQKPTPDAIINAKKQYDEVVKEIGADRPVVMWGIPIPEYGLVNGYKGEEYIVSTFRSIVNQPDTPIHYSGLMAPGGLMIMKFRDSFEIDPIDVAIKTLKRGYKLGTGDVPIHQDYVLSPDAYDVLAKNLTAEEDHDENSHHGTAYTLACLMESKWGVSEYLKKVDPILEPTLQQASETYNMLHVTLKKCHELFPMGPGDMAEDKCKKVADWLIESKKIELLALEGVKKALEIL